VDTDKKKSKFTVMTIVMLGLILMGVVILLIPKSWFSDGDKQTNTAVVATASTTVSNGSNIDAINSEIAADNETAVTDGDTVEPTVKIRTTGLLLATDSTEPVKLSYTWLEQNPTCEGNYDYIIKNVDVEKNFNGVFGGEDYRAKFNIEESPTLDDIATYGDDYYVTISDMTPIGFIDSSTVVFVYNYGVSVDLVIIRFVSENVYDEGKQVKLQNEITLGSKTGFTLASSSITIEDYGDFYAIYAEMLEAAQ